MAKNLNQLFWAAHSAETAARAALETHKDGLFPGTEILDSAYWSAHDWQAVIDGTLDAHSDLIADGFIEELQAARGNLQDAKDELVTYAAEIGHEIRR